MADEDHRNNKYMTAAVGALSVALVGGAAVLLFGVGGGAANAAAAEADKVAAADAAVAQEQLSAREAQGEKHTEGTPIQVSGCVQPPDGYSRPRYTKIPGAIFVSVASYRDDECKETLNQMYEAANRPDDLFAGVCQQNKPGQGEEDCFDTCARCAARKADGHIRVIDLTHDEARGPTFAREKCSQLWRGEEHFLQIDSHTKFEKGWDDVLREQVRLTGDPKAVLGAYPPTEDQMREIRDSGYQQFISMCVGPAMDGGIPSIRAEVQSTGGRTTPVPVAFMPGGCMCIPGEALYDVPYDPYLSYLFWGEEQLFSARLWTSGYNLYAPVKPFCVHHYGREGKPRYGADHPESDGCRTRAMQRVRRILGLVGDKAVHPDFLLSMSKYGLGDKRTLKQYWAFAGYDARTGNATKACPAP